MTGRAPFTIVAVFVCTPLFSEVAFGADVPPVPAPVVPYGVVPAAPYNWTGLYIGAHLGWGWNNSDWSYPQSGALEKEGSGFLGGVQGGFNYQFAPNWLVGLETQVSWTGINGEGAVAEDINWMTTLGPRVGYVFGTGFVYAKGGVAWAGTDLVADPPFHTLRDSETRLGWFIGAGVEHVLWNQFSAKLEYNYVGLGTESVTLSGLAGDNTLTADVNQQVHVLKAGINYRFGGFSW